MPKNRIMIKGLIARFLLFFIALLIVAFFLDPHIRFTTIWAALIITALLSVINGFVKPVLKLMTLPFTGFGSIFFALILNIALIYGLAFYVKGFEVQGVLWVLGFSFASSLSYAMMHWIAENFFGLD